MIVSDAMKQEDGSMLVLANTLIIKKKIRFVGKEYEKNVVTTLTLEDRKIVFW